MKVILHGHEKHERVLVTTKSDSALHNAIRLPSHASNCNLIVMLEAG